MGDENMTEYKGYGQFCPVAMTAEIFTAKWTPLVLRELLVGPARFNDLRKGVPRMSQSLLTKRLDDLEHSGLVEREPLTSGGYKYQLTEMGESLRPIVELMGLWGSANLKHRLTADELDPDLLFWDIRRTADTGFFDPEQRTVIHFEISGVKKNQRLWWLVCHQGTMDLCIRDPGQEVDLTVYSPISALTEAWVGYTPLKTLLQTGAIRLEGTKKQKILFPKWFILSPFANDKTNERLTIEMKQTRQGLTIRSI